MIQSDGNFKFTRMDIHLNLNPTIKNIRLAGISTLHSANVLSMNVPFRLQTEDTSNVILQLNVPHFDALFLSAGVTELIGLVQDTANIRYYGIGDVDISQLFCKSINITANGLGTIWMTGIDECVIKAEGINIVRYNFVFFRKKLRSNSCSIYFIAYSINNFMNLTMGLFLWSLTLGFQFDFECKILSYCKIRRYFTHVNFLLSLCLLTMASVNRYARVQQAQMTKHRQYYISFCKHRTTYIVVIITILFCLIANLHIPIYFEINQEECYARPGLYRLLFDIFFLIFYAILPPMSMIAINIATVIQIRKIKKLVHPTVSRSEYHLIILVITQSISNAIFTLPFTIHKFVYYVFTNSNNSENNKFAFATTLLIAFMNPGFSFFLYTLTTQSFRQEFIRACKDFLLKIKMYAEQFKTN
ncbi:hypothetical protein I4U23_018300 [Adineta vaga]|nr:hypothetical protein I4U23_018300 [Adineta vaga]